MKKYWLPILLGILVLLIFKPILGPVWYSVHDTTSIARTYLLEKTFSLGQIPAIWSAELNGGQGYPLFHFYAPLTYYTALFFKVISGSYFTGLKLTLIFAAFLGSLGMYLFMKKVSRVGAIISSFAYALLPYAAVNLYVRGAYAEYLSMMILPWLFLAWQDLSLRRKQLTSCVVTTLFILSHNLIPFIALPFLLVWILLNQYRNLKSLILPIIMTLLLSSFFLLPLIFERNFVVADQVAATTNYRDHFVVPWQLWNSTWGFGGSGPGVEDGLSFKVGKVQIILAQVGATFILFKRRKKELFFIIAACIAGFMTTPYSTFIWQSTPYQSVVQFPWRYLTLLGFFVSIMGGYAFNFIKNKFFATLTCVLVLIILLFVNLKLFVPQATFKAELNDYTNAKYLSTIPSIVPEYSPRWLSIKNPAVKDAISLPYLYYPTWRVLVDGHPVPTFPTEDGHLSYVYRGNSQNITLYQGHTELESIATMISLFTLATLIGLYVKN